MNFKHNTLEADYADMYRPKYKYTLQAVVSHIGEANIGHYVVFVRYRHAEEEHWLLYDGDNSGEALEEFVLKSQAYQLLYERIDCFNGSTSMELIDLTLNNMINEHKAKLSPFVKAANMGVLTEQMKEQEHYTKQLEKMAELEEDVSQLVKLKTQIGVLTMKNIM